MDESDISRLLDRTEETSQSIAETSNSGTYEVLSAINSFCFLR